MPEYFYNGNPILAPVTFFSNEPIFENETISLRLDRISRGVQRWELTFNTINRDDTVGALLAEIKRDEQVQSMIMLQLPEVLKVSTGTGTISLTANASRGATSASISTAGFSGKLPRGSFFNFSNHDKVYILDADINNGNTTMSFRPKLQDDVFTSNTIRHGSNCTIKFYRDTSQIKGITFNDGILSSAGSVTIREAL